MKFPKNKEQSFQSKRLKSIRIYIGMQYLPYLFLFDLSSLESIIFKCPSQLIYPKLIFRYLKKKLIKAKGNRNKKKLRMSNYEKKMFLIRGFFTICEFQHKTNRWKKSINNKYLQDFFAIRKFKNSFIRKTDQYIQYFKMQNYKKMKNWKRLIERIIKCQQDSQLEIAQKLFLRLLKLRLPWTKNMLSGIKVYRNQLFNHFSNPHNLIGIEHTNNDYQ